MPSRRTLIGGAATSVAAAVLAAPLRAQAQPRVVVVGGGFAGASCVRALTRLDRRLAVTLIEPETAYLAARSTMPSWLGCATSRRKPSAISGSTASMRCTDPRRPSSGAVRVAPGLDMRTTRKKAATASASVKTNLNRKRIVSATGGSLSSDNATLLSRSISSANSNRRRPEFW